MKKIYKSLTFVFLFFVLTATIGFANPVPMIEDDTNTCTYDKDIRALEAAIDARPPTANDIKALERYRNIIQDIDEFDSVSQFEMHADQDGTAWAKFNTPEEKVKEQIKKLVEWLPILGASIINSDAAVYSVDVTTRAMKDLENANVIIGALDKLEIGLRKRKEVQTKRKLKPSDQNYDRDGYGDQIKNNVKDIYEEYTRLRVNRENTISQMSRMADLTLCNVVHGEPMHLAKLYHETIFEDKTCNPLEKKELKALIERNPARSHGMLYQRATYDRMKAICSFRWEKLEERQDAAKGKCPQSGEGTIDTGMLSCRYDKKGRILREVQYKYTGGLDGMGKKERLEDGWMLRYHDDGSIATQIFSKDDERQGEYKSFYPTGELKHVIPYKDGKKHGTEQFLNGKGDVTDETIWENGFKK